MMKRFVALAICVMMMFAISVPASAAGSVVTRAEMAVKIAPYLEEGLRSYQGGFTDVSAGDSYANAVETVSYYGVIPGNYNEFSPDLALTNEDMAVILVKLWELRCGHMEAPELATYFSDYFDISKEKRPYVNKAVMINAVKGTSDNKMLPKSTIKPVDADALLANTVKAMETMLDFGISPIIKSFKVEGTPIGSVQSGRGQKIDFTMTVNDPSKLPYENATLLFAIYDGNRMISTAITGYTNIKQKSFAILQASGNMPDFNEFDDRNRYTVKVFIWDSASNMIPMEIEKVMK